MSRFYGDFLVRAEGLVRVYPDPRSAIIPLCHIAQEMDGYVTQDAMEHIAELVQASPAEVQGTASFYDMLKLEPVGTYVVGVCTNIACLLRGGDRLLAHAEESLGVGSGGTTPDGLVTLEEVECIAHCDKAPAVQVNYRYFGPLSPEGFDQLIGSLGQRGAGGDIPPHGTLIRVRRDAPPTVPLEEIDQERRQFDADRAARKEAQS